MLQLTHKHILDKWYFRNGKICGNLITSEKIKCDISYIEIIPIARIHGIRNMIVDINGNHIILGDQGDILSPTYETSKTLYCKLPLKNKVPIF